jgi:hypothetical protein
LVLKRTCLALKAAPHGLGRFGQNRFLVLKRTCLALKAAPVLTINVHLTGMVAHGLAALRAEPLHSAILWNFGICDERALSNATENFGSFSKVLGQTRYSGFVANIEIYGDQNGINMNEPSKTPEKSEYTTPKLEQHPSFCSVTGASFPFGTVAPVRTDTE